MQERENLSLGVELSRESQEAIDALETWRAPIKFRSHRADAYYHVLWARLELDVEARSGEQTTKAELESEAEDKLDAAKPEKAKTPEQKYVTRMDVLRLESCWEEVQEADFTTEETNHRYELFLAQLWNDSDTPASLGKTAIEQDIQLPQFELAIVDDTAPNGAEKLATVEDSEADREARWEEIEAKFGIEPQHLYEMAVYLYYDSDKYIPNIRQKLNYRGLGQVTDRMVENLEVYKPPVAPARGLLSVEVVHWQKNTRAAQRKASAEKIIRLIDDNAKFKEFLEKLDVQSAWPEYLFVEGFLKQFKDSLKCHLLARIFPGWSRRFWGAPRHINKS